MSVVTNVSAVTAHRTLALTDNSMTKSLERLSSGLRITRAADDAAGLAISSNLRVQVSGMGQAIRNAQDGISVVRTADGALDSATSILQRMRDLAVQAANDGGLDDGAKASVQKEMGQLKSELTRIATTTGYGGRSLLDGTYRGTFQVGADPGDTLALAIGSPGRGMSTAGLGLSSVDVTGTKGVPATGTAAVPADQGGPGAGAVTLTGDFTTGGAFAESFAGLTGSVSYDGRTFDLARIDHTGGGTAADFLDRLNAAAQPFFGTAHSPFTASATGLTFTGEVPGGNSTIADAAALTPTYAGRSGASAAIPLIDAAVGTVSSLRAYLGAVENRFEHAVGGLTATMENTKASVARIRDADMAHEMAAYSRNQIITQAGTAMLSHAVRAPEAILTMLR